jgi:hypothetical protein
MKNITEYITEKLVLTKNLSKKQHALEGFDFGDFLLQLYKDRYGIDLENVDFSQDKFTNERLQAILNVDEEDITILFHYIRSVLDDQQDDGNDIDEYLLFAAINDMDLSDFEDYVERTK